MGQGEGQTTKELMRILKEKHNIEISGSKHEAALLNMGYFHGFKGYRFLTKPGNEIPYKHFDEVIAVYQFDTKLKALLYPQLMFIETALKNVALDTIIKAGSADFDYVFKNLLNDYEKHEPGSAKHKRKMKSRLDLRTKIYGTISYNYNSDNPMIQHFLNDARPVPLWVIFEIINLGDFGFFLHCLNEETRLQMMDKIGMVNQANNRNARILEDIIYVIRDLRNAVAHNSAVFDCRYRKRKPIARLMNYLEAETGIEDITFATIFDDIILITSLIDKLGLGKGVVEQFIRDFADIVEELRQSVPAEIFEMILTATITERINDLKKYPLTD